MEKTIKKPRIVFMGTPDFAVGILDELVQSGHNIVGVITVADKPAGRGQKLHESAVKQYAQQKGLHILQPTNLKDEAFLNELKSLQADLQIVVAFRMLPEVVWKMPPMGTFNLHASILPNYRGAAPINWTIINGEKETGVTTFFIDDKIDTGEIIDMRSTQIDENENAGELHNRLLEMGKKLVIDTVDSIASGTAQTQKQPDINTKTAYKLTKENTKIDWFKPGREIYNLIRGLAPYPVAWTTLIKDGKEELCKIHQAKFHPIEHKNNILDIIIEKKSLKVSVQDGYIELIDIQLPGKKKYSIIDFLNGLNETSSVKFV